MNATLTDPNARAALLQRAADMLLRPGDTWPRIAQEDGSPARIYAGYLVFLAAIPALAGFIGYSLVGMGGFGFTVRVPIVQGLVSMVVGYVLSLAMVYVMALLANLLAPHFQGRADMGRALPLIAYGATAGMLGGVFQIVPALAMLGLLAALYTVYVIYLGVPVLMEVPREKALGYTAALVVCGIVAGIAMGLLTSLFTPGANARAGIDTGQVNIKVPGTEMTIDTGRIEAASRALEKAQASGDSQAAGQAMGEMLGAALGGGQAGAPFPPEKLRGFVPDHLTGLPRTGLEARADSAMGLQFSSVSAQYAQDGRELDIQIQDVGAIPALAAGMTAWARTTLDREDDTEIERIYRRGEITIKESYRKDGSTADVTMLLPNGLLVQAQGNLPAQALHQALAAMGLDQLARLKRG